jgi:ATP-dependent RNA helicase DeaD
VRERRGKEAFARMDTYRIEVGAVHGIKPGNIVGAIANEAGISGSHIGRVEIREDHSLVGLPEGMPKDIFKKLQKVRVAGRELRISAVDQREESGMSKGMERKKEQKKKPSKTLEEKRAAKREKKAARG